MSGAIGRYGVSRFAARPLQEAFDVWENLKSRARKTVTDYKAFAERFTKFASGMPLANAPLAELTRDHHKAAGPPCRRCLRSPRTMT